MCKHDCTMRVHNAHIQNFHWYIHPRSPITVKRGLQHRDIFLQENPSPRIKSHSSHTKFSLNQQTSEGTFPKQELQKHILPQHTLAYEICQVQHTPTAAYENEDCNLETEGKKSLSGLACHYESSPSC